MKSGSRIVESSINFPRAVAILMAAAALLIALGAALPSLFPEQFSMLNPVKVDTDPENMLSKDEPVRVFHDRMKEILDLHDMIVVGVVNEEHPDGVFNPESLGHIHELTQFAQTLRGEAIGREDRDVGIIPSEMIAPSLVDNIEQAGPGTVRFEWLMSEPPETAEEAVAVREKAERIPFLDGTLVSEDGKAIALYLPISQKDVSYSIYKRLQSKIEELKAAGSADEYYITGLPVAEDTFGVEMFIQMAVSAPAAMLVIFLLMLLFFRKLVLIISPLIVAIVSVICTMGLLVISGNTIHIMSSMIPIFIMPIAVLDSIHILSEFFDRYQETRDRRATLRKVMQELFMPMLYTSLTSAAGFGSLALTPIPPVQVFGVFVAFGVMLAWFLTITFIPAYIMLLSDKRLENFGAVHAGDEEAANKTPTGRFLQAMGRLTYRRGKLVIAGAVLAVIVALYGISLIRINDNPTRWFKPSHPIRVADRVLNEHFGGTYMAYLSLRPEGQDVLTEEAIDEAEEEEIGSSLGLAEKVGVADEDSGGGGDAPGLPSGLGGGNDASPSLPAGLGGAEEANDDAPSLPAGLGGTAPETPESEPAEAEPVIETEAEIFKQPEVLRYLGDLQDHLLTTGAVGKSNSLTDIVKTVHRELIDGSPEAFRVPDTPQAVAQTLMQYQSSHRPKDLWHFVTPDYRMSSVWVQLTSGDNAEMSKVVAAVDEYIEEHPLVFTIDGEEVRLEPQWFGLTYINVVWQDKMVSGMLQAFLGSFLVVLLMMIILFRSGLWGLLSMIPLTVTVGLIYGVIGLIGKDYDMPVAVLSSLSLGLAIDFAIHFLARSRAMYERFGSWKAAYPHAFGEPARAITRNVIVIAVGFTPLLLAPLRPYNTVGVFLASILLLSGAATLLLLPALIRQLEPLLFPSSKFTSVLCMSGTCIASAVAAVILLAVNIHQFLEVGLTTLTWISAPLIIILAGLCGLMSNRERCRRMREQSPEQQEA